ncbi:transcriptional regulator [Halosegnis rubeus]|jgi:ribosome-binding protein aMBF1 (putative translation factor)|uniref:Transcriptional regulator n=1 Tax=Halosegnis rubeus TaxID=2212850 RepID=A0A5N5U8Z9_9EURY|nr:multiprotein-bridging factor 1 family protein [Halosegnis rubeus]KAB7515007.1 transcriptional regulator [Halosegnis rubeus]KAB7518317.1 transcriptional regulator [Halosegnis rubeus]KAB7519104.1 transcriptional regulator [Halosegnis rubeus]
MAKYSTGGVGSDDADSCELCGKEGVSLTDETVAGARLQVCSDCSQHGEQGGKTQRETEGRDEASPGDDTTDRRRKAAQNAARMADANAVDSSRWEQGTDYEDDPLPYLVSDYGDVMSEARQAAGLQTSELAGELGVTEADVLAVEQGRANRANIPGSLIEAIEERLNVQLSDE